MKIRDAIKLESGAIIPIDNINGIAMQNIGFADEEFVMWQVSTVGGYSHDLSEADLQRLLQHYDIDEP